MNKEDNISRERYRQMAAGKDKKTIIGEDGIVYFVDQEGNTGEPVKKPDGTDLRADTTKQDNGINKAIADAVAKKEAALDKADRTKVTIPGDPKPKTWRSATAEERDAYLQQVEQEETRRRTKASGGTKIPGDAARTPPAWAN